MAKRKSSSLSVAELHREIRRRERSAATILKRLERRRDAAQAKADAIQAEMDTLARQLGMAGSRTGRRKRAKNDSNLADALHKLLTGKTLSVTAITEAVQKAGYVTTSPNFRIIVNQALTKHKKIKRVGRGLYTAK